MAKYVLELSIENDCVAPAVSHSFLAWWGGVWGGRRAKGLSRGFSRTAESSKAGSSLALATDVAKNRLRLRAHLTKVTPSGRN